MRSLLTACVIALLLGCINCGGGGTTPPPPPPPAPTISSFTATPASITAGQSSTLAWTVSGASTLSIDHGVGSVSGTSASVSPTATTTYTLTATNSSGNVTATATVTVTLPKPTIASFTANPASIDPGQSSTLSWSVIGATSISIDNSVGAVTGTSTTVTPAGTTTYTLTATNASGSTTATTMVTVQLPLPEPKTWFAPLGVASSNPTQGSVDYMDLFTATAPWSEAASHIQVFKLYAGLLGYPDDDLRKLFADLKRRNIALALEFGPLESSSCGIGVEGFNGVAVLGWAQRIRDLGGDLRYLAFDEPFFYANMYTGASACNWTPEQVAQNAAEHVAQIKTVFPDAIVGDIEVVPASFVAPDWLDRYQAWMDAWEKVTGKPLAFFHCDVPSNSDWRPAVAALQRVLKQRQIPFGMIYTGTFADSTDADWVNTVESFFTEYETKGSPMPDQVIFQSWQPYPKHLLPETDLTTFTHLIDRYFRTRTSLTSSANNSDISGSLSQTKSGAVISGAEIKISAMPLSGTGQEKTFTRTGAFPAGTQYITFGLRAHTECDASGPADILVNSFSLDAGAAGTLAAEFVTDTGWGWWGNPTLVQLESPNMHVKADLGHSLGMNHYAMSFAPPAGSTFTLNVKATIPSGALGNVCAIMVFQSASQTELGRVSILMEPQPIAIGTTATAADGSYTLDLSSYSVGNSTVWAQFAGTDTLWPAASASLMGGFVPMAITTESPLPSATAGTAYSQSFAATGGRRPYLWVGKDIPAGLRLNSDGTLTGTPAAGDYTFTVTAIDDTTPTQVAEKTFRLIVQ